MTCDAGEIITEDMISEEQYQNKHSESSVLTLSHITLQCGSVKLQGSKEHGCKVRTRTVRRC